jgi:hypothetical protein
MPEKFDNRFLSQWMDIRPSRDIVHSDIASTVLASRLPRMDKRVVWKADLHWLMLLGVFLNVAGIYATMQNIVDAYAAGTIGSAYSCADN